jgi:hypothetical protein
MVESFDGGELYCHRLSTTGTINCSHPEADETLCKVLVADWKHWHRDLDDL